MRRLVIAATALAILAGGAGVASAATGKSDRSGASVDRRQHELCVLIDAERGPLPPYICLNW